MLNFHTQLLAQSKEASISGRITDENNEELPNATVKIRNDAIRFNSNLQDNYNLMVNYARGLKTDDGSQIFFLVIG
ncbi:carboxypeptidase-like regulatory domain-containing protein [Catalinimonas niigatensis]|uniref:carboxypeptidase-like regulatory domain-containing protein n=1 Tax=Catalinimonas niigatensis TaxID=1397264 RepID=UPI00266670CC|nr:carboxypeptidase-like regulatory domain-containing protein [Catalinimonas niigatensis]WPP48487.1 carboxypeptidase-like regulatory domain-containing protein [Catalinimonas niigatensis]